MRESIIRYWRITRCAPLSRAGGGRAVRHYALPFGNRRPYITIRKNLERRMQGVNYVKLIGRMAAECELG